MSAIERIATDKRKLRMNTARQSVGRGAEAGFTLVELMAVVVIVGVLALIGTYSVRKYVTSSKTSEATQMIATIKAAQESYKDETFGYLNVTGTLDTFYPNNSNPGRAKMQWGGGDATIAGKWQALGVSAASPVLFRYSCVAGASGAALPVPSDITISNWPGTVNSPWYVVKADADFEGDGRRTVFVGASFDGQIFGTGT